MLGFGVNRWCRSRATRRWAKRPSQPQRRARPCVARCEQSISRFACAIQPYRSSAEAMPMASIQRLFLCVSCSRQQLICSACDRGHRYCAQGCSKAARRRSLRAAGARYQRSRRGRVRHATRQRDYRARQKKVTHQGSPWRALEVSLPTSQVVPSDVLTKPSTVPMAPARCHFCGCAGSLFVRLSYLRRGAVLFDPFVPIPRPARPSG